MVAMNEKALQHCAARVSISQLLLAVLLFTFSTLAIADTASVDRPNTRIGIELAADSDERKELLISEVAVGSPAQKAGLMAGDKILSVNGITVSDYNELIDAIYKGGAIQALAIIYARQGTNYNTELTPVEKIFTHTDRSKIELNEQYRPPESDSALFRDCQAMTEDDFRNFIANNTAYNTREALSEVDLKDIVATSWYRSGLEERYVKLVKTTVAEEEKNSSFVKNIASVVVAPGWAEEMAEETVSKIFKSSEFESISADLTEEVSKSIAQTSAVKAASSLTQASVGACLEGFLSAKYTSTIAGFFKEVVPELDGNPISTDSVTGNSIINISGILIGLLAIIGRRIIARVIRSVVIRVVRGVSIRLLAWATGFGGIAILVYEVLAGAAGPYPIIEEELLSNASREEIFVSFASSIESGLNEEIDKAAFDTASILFREYADFKNQHYTLLSIAENDERARDIIGNFNPTEMLKAATVASLLENKSGKSEVENSFHNGVMQRSVKLSDDALSIAQDTGDIENALAWYSVVPAQINSVKQYELHKLLDVKQYQAEQIIRLLSIPSESGEIPKLANLGIDDLKQILSLPREILVPASNSLNRTQLEGLSDVLKDIDNPEERKDISNALISSEKSRSLILKEDFRFALARSDNKSAAAEAISKQGVFGTITNMKSFVSGDINLGLLTSLYPYLYWIMGIILLPILLKLIRVFRR